MFRRRSQCPSSPLRLALVIAAAIAAAPAAPIAGASAGQQLDGDARETTNRIGWIVLDGPLAEKPDPFGWLVGEDPDATLAGVLSKFEDAAVRDDIREVVIRIKDLQIDLTQSHAIRSAIQQAQGAGKRVTVFADFYGPSELILASAADEILIQRAGMVSFPGIYAEEWYLADTLKLVGLEGDFIQVGDYKGASEQFARNSPSEEWSRNIDRVLDNLWEQMQRPIKEGRGYSDAEWREVLDKAWALEAEEALELGLVDGVMDSFDLRGELESRYEQTELTTDLGESYNPFQIDFANPFAMFQIFSKQPRHTPTGPTIAVVHIDGPIVDGESSPASMFGGETVGAATVREALHEIQGEPLIKGLVVRINSPGGSATASDMIWQAVRSVADEKPVFVSVGSMAASGGYYIAVSGDKIFVDPSSIVGSIGVVGGKIVMGGLYDKLEVGVTPRARGPHAELMDSRKAWSPEQSAMMRQLMVDVYEQFVERVKQGRGADVDMAKIGEGRLFTGEEAIELDMADGIAGFEEVIQLVAQEAGVGWVDYDVMTYPGPKSFEEMIEEMLPFAASAEARIETAHDLGAAIGVGVLRELVGDRNWPAIRDGLNGLMLLRERPIILMNPRVLTFN